MPAPKEKKLKSTVVELQSKFTMSRFCYLVDQFMGDDAGHPLLVGGRRLVLVVQQVGLPVSDQTPVLHGTGAKVRDGYLIWVRAQRVL